MQEKRKIPRRIRLLFYGLFPIFFALYPTSLAENGLFRCPSSLVGLSCPACGVTRALAALFKGQFAEAVGHNALFVTVLLPLLFLIALQDTVTILRKGETSLLEFLWRGGRL